MDLDLSDHFLLLMLRENPFISYNELAKAMNISPNTVRARIQRLKQGQLLRGDSDIDDPVLGKRNISEVFANPNYSALGLNRIDVIINGVTDDNSLQSVYRLLDAHPYTIYRSFGFSTHPMVYAVFAMPSDPSNYLVEFLELMKSHGFFDGYSLFHFPNNFSTREMLEYWDVHLGLWKYDVNNLSFTKYYGVDMEKTDPIKFSCFDLLLLRELTINAKVKISDLAQHYKYDRTTISRHMNYVKSNLVHDYGVIYDRSVFTLGNFRLFWGEWSDGTFLKSLMEQKFPFNSTVSFDDRRFFWLVQASDPILNDLSMLLFKEVKNLHQAIIYPETGVRYYFYPYNYDCDAKKWKYEKAQLFPELQHLMD